MKKFTVKNMALVGVLAALVFVGSMIQIPIPTALGNTRLHLGNICCLLAGIILGPVSGGFAAAIGSAFFDLTNPMYIDSIPFTFTFKFMMAFVCGMIAWKGGARGSVFFLNIPATVLGALTYLILYLSRYFIHDYFFLRTELQTALIDIGQRAVVSGVNGIVAAIGAVPLATALRKGLDRAGIRL